MLADHIPASAGAVGVEAARPVRAEACGNIGPDAVLPHEESELPVHARKALVDPVESIVDRVEAPSLLSYRWHPYAVDPAVDYAAETPTLVTFTLADTPGGGTRLTVVESGFDQVPPQRRLEAFRMNSGGWEGQMENIVRHVAS